MIVLISEPNVTVQESPEEISTWNAVWHPIVYRFQRQDFHIESGDVTANPGTGGDTVILIQGETISELQVGHFIWVSYDGIEGLYEVLEISFAGGDTEIIIETGISFSSPMDGGYINLITPRSFYMIEIKIIRYDIDSAGTEVTTSYAQFRPSNNAGDIKADVQSWLQILVSSNNTFGYDAVSELDTGLGQAYGIELREYWKEIGYGEFIGTALFGVAARGVVNAVKQIGQKWGQNMAEYVMQEPVGGHTLGKFLSGFETPVYYEDYPFDISFIKSEVIGPPPDLIKLERHYDINNNQVGSSQTVLSLGGESNEFLGVVRLMLAGGYASNVYKVEVSLFSDSVGIGNQVSEFKYVLKNDCDKRNPEYFAWLNKHGGFDYWMFYQSQEISDNTFDEAQFERYVENLENSNARAQTLKKRIQEQIFLRADLLTFSEVEALRHILSSPKVFRYLGIEDDEHKWEVVTVLPGSFPIKKTSETKASISFSILPPERFNQQNG